MISGTCEEKKNPLTSFSHQALEILGRVLVDVLGLIAQDLAREHLEQGLESLRHSELGVGEGHGHGCLFVDDRVESARIE